MKSRFGSIRPGAPGVFLLIMLGVAAAPRPQQDDIQWLDNYRDALLEARRTGKPIFLEFRCEP